MMSAKFCLKAPATYCGVPSRGITCLGRRNATQTYSLNGIRLKNLQYRDNLCLNQRKKSIGCRRSRERAVTVHSYKNDTTIPDRVISGLPYLLPLFDGLRYGKFLFVQYPVMAKIISPLNPLIQVYFSVPFAGLVAFFGVYLGIINNFNMPRVVRVNAMQAILLDIVLILPGLLESVLKLHPTGGLGLQVYVQIYNAIFLFIIVSVGYGLVSCMVGNVARIPFISEAADAQVR